MTGPALRFATRFDRVNDFPMHTEANPVVFPTKPTSRSHGIAHWMERVLKERQRMKKSFSAEAVHDLRVALRRCRTIGAGMVELDDPAKWRAMRKTGRALFRRLGKLRDVQVLKEWVTRLAALDNAFARELLDDLTREEVKEREKGAHALEKFNRKRWKKLMPDLAARMEQVELNGPETQYLGVDRLEEALRLHRRALRTKRAEDWHRLRIGLKRLRYVVENFLPARRAAIGPGLARLQDLLGDAHDLDVLLERIEGKKGSDEPSGAKQLIERARGELTARLAEYRPRMTGRKAPWGTWRHTLSAPVAARPALTPRATGAVLEWPATGEGRAAAPDAPSRGRRRRIS
jgi:CHAD domain-containing protein